MYSRSLDPPPQAQARTAIRKIRMDGRIDIVYSRTRWSGSAPPATTTRSGRAASIRRISRRRRCCRTTRSGSTRSRSTTPSTGCPTRSWSPAGRRRRLRPGRSRSRRRGASRTTAGSKNCGELVSGFCRVAATLGDKLGTLLFQLPPNLKKDLAPLRRLPGGPAAAGAGRLRVPQRLVAGRRGVRAPEGAGTWRSALPTARSCPRR